MTVAVSLSNLRCIDRTSGKGFHAPVADMDASGVAKRTGTIVKFDAERGFGFIAPASGTGDLFFHVSSVSGERQGVAPGETIQYEIGLDKEGRFEAKRVWRHTAQATKRPVQTSVLVAIMIAAWFFIGITLLAATGRTPFWIVGYLAVMSVASFALYAHDKKSAERGLWRTSESSLHMFDLCGGWPGGIIAQQVLPHKRRKTGFMAITAFIVCMHVLAWSWLTVGDRSLSLDLRNLTLEEPAERPGDTWAP